MRQLAHHESAELALAWLRARGAQGLATDSRQVRPGDAFIAWPGYAADGRRHVSDALAAGASACLVEAEGADAFAFDDERVATLSGLKAATGEIASRFHGAPSTALSVLAITGTNGKTSTAWWTAQALSLLGRRSGVIGTLGAGEPASTASPRAHLESTGLTTPDPVTLQSRLRQFADAGFAACAIEASSIGIVEQRLAGTHIEIAVYTNFTRDHLDYHGSMTAYWEAKSRLFDWPGLRCAVVNMDDEQGEALAAQLRHRPELGLWTYSSEGEYSAPRAQARLQAHSVGFSESADEGLQFELTEKTEGGEELLFSVRTRLAGDYNVSNLLAVFGTLRALGVSMEEAVSVAPHLTSVPGRMQRVLPDAPATHENQPAVIVDYAHTPDALEKALQALRRQADARGGRLWCVFGCGGGRDVTKRPLMGAVAEKLADRVILTSDNPRRETPAHILSQIAAGLSDARAAVRIEDRAAAIAQAVLLADARDVVLIAGKGHELDQEIDGVKRPFSDLAQAGQALRRRAAGAPMFTLGEAHTMLPGSVLVGEAGTPIDRVHTDTRSLQPGDLFVALKGERFDAHDFLPEALAAGASAAIAQHGLEAANGEQAAAAGLPGLVVDDTRRALGELAAAWRARFELPLIAVTGSNGKTTVTQMIASILRAWLGDAAFSTQGNLNNDVGVPLTLLRLRRDAAQSHGAAVVELGMNHPGEIAGLARMAAPTVALVNNAQREHQEFMANVEAVARENGSVFDALGAEGVAVFPSDDPHAPTWRQMAGARRTLTFALEGEADVTGTAAWLDGLCHMHLRTPQGAATCSLLIAGWHNVKNALAATASALAAGCPLDAVVRGLESFVPVKGRSELKSFELDGRVVTLVDDTYNANPDSVRAAVDVLESLPGPRWMVLGDMGEVGNEGPAFHREVGAYAAEAGLDHFWTLGTLCVHAAEAFDEVAAPGRSARHFPSMEALLGALGSAEMQSGAAPAAASLLVKGSRFMKMEQVVAAVAANAAAPSQEQQQAQQHEQLQAPLPGKGARHVA